MLIGIAIARQKLGLGIGSLTFFSFPAIFNQSKTIWNEKGCL
jgi:hypothetical protein